MNKSYEWMIHFIPTLILTLVMIITLLSANPWIVQNYLQVSSLAVAPINFIKNVLGQVGIKYLAGG